MSGAVEFAECEEGRVRQRAAKASRALRSVLIACCLAAASVGGGVASADPLPHRASAMSEQLSGVESEWGEILTPDGYRLRTIVTRPRGAAGRLPAVYFAQWLSCDSIEVTDARDGWTQMLRLLIERSGFVVVRLEKAGVGDSEGPDCGTRLDYETELRDHRQAFVWASRHSWIDRSRLFIFGASMGATFAPMIGEGQSVRGLAVWGGGARTWFERQLAFERSALELSGAPFAELDARMRDTALFYSAFLLDGRDPDDIAGEDEGLGRAWRSLHGASDGRLFGRAAAFHVQAQSQSWAGAWSRIRAPVLVLAGEYDWFEDPDSARLIADIVNDRRSGGAVFRLIPNMDHHFTLYSSRRAAFLEEGGAPDPSPVTERLFAWLRSKARSDGLQD